jgi:hypothetical protein
MNNETINETIEKAAGQIDMLDTASVIKEWEEVKEAVDATVSETSLPDKVTELYSMLENLSGEVDSWKNWLNSLRFCLLTPQVELRGLEPLTSSLQRRRSPG